MFWNKGKRPNFIENRYSFVMEITAWTLKHFQNCLVTQLVSASINAVLGKEEILIRHYQYVAATSLNLRSFKVDRDKVDTCSIIWHTKTGHSFWKHGRYVLCYTGGLSSQHVINSRLKGQHLWWNGDEGVSMAPVAHTAWKAPSMLNKV